MMNDISYITRTDPVTGAMTSPDTKRKVFISYKHSDEMQTPLCRRMASYILERHDVAVWYDRQLTAGKEYDEEIFRAIRSCDVFVLLLTPTILSSDYIWNQEVPFAQQNHLSIIPVIAGISETELRQVEDVIGRVHMPVWFFGQEQQPPAFPQEALQQFHNGLSVSIANKDIMSQVMLFYDRGNHKTSLRYLNFEQIFMKAYGCLFGVDEQQDKHIGEMLMETILRSYGDDEEFLALQKQVAEELLKHFYRSNQPELFVSYLKPMLEKGFDHLYSLLFDIYRQQWHSEIMQREPELTMALFTHLYRKYTASTWDPEQINQQLENGKILQLSQQQREAHSPHIGEIIFGTHTAYLQRSETEDRTVCLMLDGYCLQKYDIYASVGDVSFVYLAYDAAHDLLVAAYSDFDHYGPETDFSGTVFRLDQDQIQSVSFSFEPIRGIRPLPYSPYTFGLMK